MAPEQLAGGEVTARSDIYALGLVLYELFTGKRALEGSNLAELIRKREQAGIVPPSAIVARPRARRSSAPIMRCLRPSQPQRPASALSVSAALPGGDPLAAALAAGETPSPEMVAAAGEDDVLRRGVGIALLAFTLIGLGLAAYVASRGLLVNRVAFTKSADVLAERAREIIALAGYTDTPADTARGVAVNMEYVRWVEPTTRRRRNGTRSPTALPRSWTSGSAPARNRWCR